uniref:COP9 signalosome complex subunit 9 n=1 Tax=Ficedula albicollis TaxID=59894 RepID=A0A803W696_FICAL
MKPARLLSQAGGSTGLLMDLAANEKAVHADFFNGKERRAAGVVSANLAWLLPHGAWWSLNCA